LAGSASNATAHETTLLEMLDDYDNLLSSDANFMLGTWITWSRSWSDEKVEQDFFEFNARNQITLWGPTGQINDYAAKSWGGLVSSYYKPRWALFTKQVLGNITDLDKFDGTNWLQQIGLPWSNSTTSFPIVPVGDTVDIASALFDKYVK
jgi:alpha-N-acetylglucosaminidase